MVGSRDSVAAPNVVLNTIVAESFSDACDVLEKAEDFDLAATLGLLSDVAAIASAASNVETNACLRAPAETTGQRANKEKTKVEG